MLESTSAVGAWRSDAPAITSIFASPHRVGGIRTYRLRLEVEQRVQRA
jgi:hypothetical protein